MNVKRSAKMISIVVAIAVVMAGVASAKPLVPPEVITLSDLVQMSAEPGSIAADGESTSVVQIAVFYPDLEDLAGLGGAPAAHTSVLVGTTLGELTDFEDKNNTGKDITVVTGANGVVSVLVSGTVPGVANITARAVGIQAIVNDLLANETTSYLVYNTMTVTLLEPGPKQNGGGGNGGAVPTTPPAGTAAYLALTANPGDIPADGTSTSTLTASVWDGEGWVMENLRVNFSTSKGTITASAVMVNGTATAILTGGTEEGVATVTGEANVQGAILTNTTSVSITAPGVTPTPTPTVVTPTPMVTTSPTPAVTPSPSPTSKPLIPGFEAGVAILGLLAVAYLGQSLMRKKRP
jgi:hypothetical protein